MMQMPLDLRAGDEFDFEDGRVRVVDLFDDCDHETLVELMDVPLHERSAARRVVVPLALLAAVAGAYETVIISTIRSSPGMEKAA